MTDQELIEFYNEFLSYDPKTGIFTWKKKRKGVTNRGIAGTVNSCGYIIITYKGNKILAHRLAYLITYKVLPKSLDHIDRDKTNNKISNLRECTQSENMINRGLNKNNTSGYKGVTWDKSRGMWSATIKYNYKIINLGRFNCKHQAARVYNTASRMYHGQLGYTNIINI